MRISEIDRCEDQGGMGGHSISGTAEGGSGEEGNTDDSDEFDFDDLF